MKKLWKIVAGLIVLGAAMVITGCSHEPSYYYDVKYVRVSANDYNNNYKSTTFEAKEDKSLSWPGDSSFEEKTNLSKAEIIEFFIDKNANSDQVKSMINSFKPGWTYFQFFSTKWDETSWSAAADVDCFRVYTHQ